MGSDCAKNCSVAAIRNNDSSRILSLAILLIVLFPIVIPRAHFPIVCPSKKNPYCHVQARFCSRKVTGVMAWVRRGVAGEFQPVLPAFAMGDLRVYSLHDNNSKTGVPPPSTRYWNHWIRRNFPLGLW